MLASDQNMRTRNITDQNSSTKLNENSGAQKIGYMRGISRACRLSHSVENSVEYHYFPPNIS